MGSVSELTARGDGRSRREAWSSGLLGAAFVALWLAITLVLDLFAAGYSIAEVLSVARRRTRARTTKDPS